MAGPVVVGVDGSESSMYAVRLAAREAAYRQLRLHIVHAFVWPLVRVPLGPVPGGPESAGLTRAAEKIVEEARQQAATVAPECPISSDIIEGVPISVMLEQAADADLAVVGSRGLGAVTGLLVGSVAIALVTHTGCPVLIARGNDSAPAEAPVVAGVDGSDATAGVLEFAFAEAHFRDVPLAAVHAWTHSTEDPVDRDRAEAAGDRVLAESLAGWQDRYPDVPVLPQTPRNRAVPALIEASAHAQLVVVGARGHRRRPGPRIGSVGAALVRHAESPVAVIRPAQ